MSNSDRKPYDGYGLSLPSVLNQKVTWAMHRTKRNLTPKPYRVPKAELSCANHPMPWYMIPDILVIDEG